jgi:uncharacterized membrane protein YqjE
MTGETSRSRNPAGRGGLFTNLLALANSLASFFEARLAVFTRESKTALVQLLVVAASLVAAAVLLAFGYVFLLATAIVGLARVTNFSWEWIALIAAGVHVLLAIICIVIAATRLKRHPFPETAAELKKDREWLRNLDQSSRPNN